MCGNRAGNSTLNGGDGNDVIYAFGGRNFVLGGDAIDVLVGQSSALLGDTMTGGAGADKFFTEAAGLAADTITDFSHAQGDNVIIHADNYGTYTAGRLVDLISGTGGAAGIYGSNTAQGFGYDTGTGDLYFKVSGPGAGGAAIISHLTGASALLASDIVVSA